jgi:nucleotide-binding universal stress UspA family protein
LGYFRKKTMEKILLAMEGCRQNTYAIDFACYIAKLTGSRLTGVFLEGDPDGSGPEHALTEELIPAGEYYANANGTDPVLQQVHQFREACTSREVLARVHRDRGVPLRELLRESRFSDLVIVDPEMSFRRQESIFLGHFIRDVLVSAECPVLVSPYRCEALEEVIFAYDGSASSVFAIKQFTYLFPAFRQKKATVVNVRKVEGPAIEEQFRMKEWFTSHYDQVQFVVLSGNASDELFGYLLEKKEAIVVLGAYGRGLLSRAIKPSHAGLLLRTINLPVFIAHR